MTEEDVPLGEKLLNEQIAELHPKVMSLFEHAYAAFPNEKRFLDQLSSEYNSRYTSEYTSRCSLYLKQKSIIDTLCYGLKNGRL